MNLSKVQITSCNNFVLSWNSLFWLYVLIMSRTHFTVNPHSIFAWMSRNSLLETIWPNWPNDWAVLWIRICTVHLTVCSYVLYVLKLSFQKIEVVGGKSPFFVLGPCTPHEIYLNIGFWLGSFPWQCCAFNSSSLN